MRKFVFLIPIVPIVLLVAAIFFHPRGSDFYHALRCVITLSAALLAGIHLSLFDDDLNVRFIVSFLLATVIAVLYNPIVPFYLDRETWLPINVLTIIFFGIHAFAFVWAIKKDALNSRDSF